jgi:hypothetical protein
LLSGGVGAIALVFVVLFPVVFAFLMAKHRLGPPRVRGLSPGEAPRYIQLITEPAARRFEQLGFRRAGYMATQPIMQAEPEVVQLVMRNDETRTLAYVSAGRPFSEAHPSMICFESFLPDGTLFGTSARFMPVIGPPLPNRRRSDADDDEGMYRDHLASFVRSGLAAIELPATFEGLVALSVNDAAWIWRTRLEQGVVVPSDAGGFRYARWASMLSVPKILWAQWAKAIVQVWRRRSDRAKGPIVDASAPEIKQFLEDRARRQREALAATRAGFKTSRTRTAILWVSMVFGFVVFWQLLNHQRHAPRPPYPAESAAPPVEPDDSR